ncbi:adenylyl-sulfate kinase [Paenibacillus wulumuqiensis]|uniref:adenylyl-sulfate kinase n=1 Tax=Paenibacillus wulumuqiensis TaxID=1567107 RepID=UPI0006195390|nr:adenylyl-sulfate kinase [Paenibacillus wulumuqiensis]
MNTKLIMIEGLPGSGKSTVAQMVSEILSEQGKQVLLFQEGDPEHPADHESVSFYKGDEFAHLLSRYEKYAELLENRAMKYHSDFLLPYQKIKNEQEVDFPDELWHELSQKDIYELPFEQNMEIVTHKWNDFQRESIHTDSIFVFECCFMQNPLTVGTVKYNRDKKEVVNYVLQLENSIKPLEPLLIYIDQQNIGSVFEKAVQERPKTWSDGFIKYYTEQGFGKVQGYNGLEGTIQVLHERKNIELEIFDLLSINKRKIDNSYYNMEKCREEIRGILGALVF